jgi:G:T-mismatch repair DNA endonuclease (very short patch repair protein)
VCGKEFSQWRIGRTPKTCSRECRIKSKDKIVSCLQCGKEFRVSAGKKNKFCTSACANKYNKKPNPEKKKTFTCKWCGKEFVTWAYRNPTMCSRQCASEYGARQDKPGARKPENKITKNCSICGKPFTVHKCQDEGKRNALYCSVMCRLKSHISAPEKRCKKILEDIGVEFEHQNFIKDKFYVDFAIGKTILQVDGEYWHGHPRYEPLSDRQKQQRARDRAQTAYLEKCGYKVVRVWESDITKENIISLLYS